MRDIDGSNEGITVVTAKVVTELHERLDVFLGSQPMGLDVEVAPIRYNKSTIVATLTFKVRKEKKQ